MGQAKKAFHNLPERAWPPVRRTSELGLVPGGPRERAAGFFAPEGTRVHPNLETAEDSAR
jgi:hypothetical protein